jgi:hypothetical protein
MTGRVEIVNGTELHLRDAHGPGVTITFQRTLRIPDDGRTYPLPPGLGAFPLRLVRNYASRVPAGWAARGGVFLPMYQREAMWLSFGGEPHALKVGVGKVCAVSGERWRDGLRAAPQNYVVVGPQPWLDGIASGTGTIRQFVAMPLGLGYTVEGQIAPTSKLAGVASVQQIDQTKSTLPLQDDGPVAVKQVKKLWWKHHPGAVIVDDGDW